jgi:xylulose-5-phosphate/fructose-6-phosphate phosphoketolase
MAAYAQQAIRDKLIEHKAYLAKYGEDMPEVRTEHGLLRENDDTP